MNYPNALRIAELELSIIEIKYFAAKRELETLRQAYMDNEVSVKIAELPNAAAKARFVVETFPKATLIDSIKMLRKYEDLSLRDAKTYIDQARVSLDAANRVDVYFGEEN